MNTTNPPAPVGNETDPVARAVREQFGIPYIYPWQRLVIANILDAAEAVALRPAEVAQKNAEPADADSEPMDEDGLCRGRQIVLLPTGAGKSLCFQAPTLFLSGPTLVIYPLLGLMNDQLRRLDSAGIPAVTLRGGQDRADRNRILKRLENGRAAFTDGPEAEKPVSVIIANPEVLAAPGVLDALKKAGIAHLAIDEAHCVSEWGDSFRPSYLELGKIIAELNPPVVTAFTATASPGVLARISEVLFEGNAHLVRGESDRPNLRYAVRQCVAKKAALIREVHRAERPAIVFCSSRVGTERTAQLLRLILDDPDIRYYHAALTREEKIETEHWFMEHRRAVLVATCAFGMGMDKSDIRTVIHLDPPPTAEAYIQEAGRGGRDGGTSRAILLWSPADRRRLERLEPLPRSRAGVLVRMAESGRCRREVLLEALGETRATPEAPEGQQLACSGCDVCEGRSEDKPADALLVLDTVRKNRRCFTRSGLAAFLTGRGNTIARESGNPHWWCHADFTEITGELIREGKIRERSGCLWGRVLELKG